MYSLKTWNLTAISLTALLFAGGCGFELEEQQPKQYTLSGPAAVLFNIEGAIPQFHASGGLVPSLAKSQYQLEKLVEKASTDPLVQEILFHLGPSDLTMARGGEIAKIIREALTRGKPVTCHLDQADNTTYWIAAQACPRIFLSPAGSVEILGLGLETIFIREMLASLGVRADMMHIGRFKSAAEPLTRDTMSDDARTAATELLFELHDVFSDGIAMRPLLEKRNVQSILDNGPYAAEDAIELKLVDGQSTLAELVASTEVKYAAGVVDDYGKKPAKPFSISEFLKIFSKEEEDEKKKSAPFIALVPVIGPISSGQSDELLGGVEMVSDSELIEALSELQSNDAARAVVLRIDSPGGSALASDNIWQAVRSLSEKKPVVASMGEVAASGGYYIASAARETFAMPATITGSIGVVGGKVVIDEAVQKLGIKVERIETAKRAHLLSPFTSFDENSRGAIRRLMQKSYDLFVDRVAEGRKLAKADVLKVAEGRVWTGSQALKNKLVDKLGSLGDAISRARTLAQLSPQIPVELYPKPKALMDILSEAFTEPETRVLQAMTKRYKSLGRALAFSNLLIDQRVLTFAPIFFDIR